MTHPARKCICPVQRTAKKSAISNSYVTCGTTATTTADDDDQAVSGGWTSAAHGDRPWLSGRAARVRELSCRRPQTAAAAATAAALKASCRGSFCAVARVHIRDKVYAYMYMCVVFAEVGAGSVNAWDLDKKVHIIGVAWFV